MPNMIPLRKYAGPIELRNKTEKTAEILLYGTIGSGGWFDDGITAKAFAETMKQIPDSVQEIAVRINSPGGDVFEGWAIYNRIKQSKKKIVCYVDGIAASIASIIAMAGEEVVMGEASQLMIHNSWTIASGNANDFEAVIQRLNDIDQQLVSVYAKKTGLSRPEIQKMMDEETWMLAEDAVDKGFANSVASETMPIAASIIDKAKWINKAPKNILFEADMIKQNIGSIQDRINQFLKK